MNTFKTVSEVTPDMVREAMLAMPLHKWDRKAIIVLSRNDPRPVTPPEKTATAWPVYIRERRCPTR